MVRKGHFFPLFKRLYLLKSPLGVAVYCRTGAAELRTKTLGRARFQLFPCVGSLRERRARGDHVQQVLPLTSVNGS